MQGSKAGPPVRTFRVESLLSVGFQAAAMLLGARGTRGLLILLAVTAIYDWGLARAQPEVRAPVCLILVAVPTRRPLKPAL